MTSRSSEFNIHIKNLADLVTISFYINKNIDIYHNLKLFTDEAIPYSELNEPITVPKILCLREFIFAACNEFCDLRVSNFSNIPHKLFRIIGFG